MTDWQLFMIGVMFIGLFLALVSAGVPVGGALLLTLLAFVLTIQLVASVQPVGVEKVVIA